MAARDHELLHAAKRIAAALGRTPDEVMRRVVELGRGDRVDWSSSELLLCALAQLAAERPIPSGAGGRAATIENIEAPSLGVTPGRPVSTETEEGDIT
ncbi:MULTISPECIES: hypothetical protein [unclassified Streptosporangium]|uniref:hypothetical protein n=1 Tax=unclassified Streptosporangium TaxID=2632669 RepID=UPI002E29DE10|nr:MULTISPECIES: hypothetical protein [unclassified Streptosporangium]